MLRVNTLADTSAGPFDFVLEYPEQRAGGATSEEAAELQRLLNPPA